MLDNGWESLPALAENDSETFFEDSFDEYPEEWQDDPQPEDEGE